MAFFWREISGREGKVMVPSLGAVIGIMNNWTLRRREEADPGNPGLLTLRASFSYVNEYLMSDTEMAKKVTVVISKDTHYQVRSPRVAWDGQTLVMEESELCREE